MNWFVWRQHRKQFLTFGVLLALYAALAIPTGLHFWHEYQFAKHHCMSFATSFDPHGTCDQLRDKLFQSNIDAMFRLIPIVVLFLPAILGIFLGAPLLAKEYGEGTNKLVWTQGISRKKWLSVKLLWVLFASALFTTGITAISTWWSRPINAVYLNRFGIVPFSTQGIVPVAATIFAVTLGIALSAWLRRTIAAMGVTLGILVVLGLIVVPNVVRQHYMKPITISSSMGSSETDNKIPNGSWILSRGTVDKHGKSLNSFSPADMPTECQLYLQNIQLPSGGRAVQVKSKGVDPLAECLNRHGYRQLTTYQPSYRYWDFQRIESGLYLALSIIPVGATYWLVLKRDS